MRKKFFAVLSLLLIFPGPGTSFAESDWRHEFTRDGISVYTRETSMSWFREIRSEGIVDAPMEECQRVLMDIENIHKWQPDCKSARLLAWEKNNVLIAYNETQTPWPSSNRDVVTRSVVTATEDTITHSISAIDRTDLVPLKKNTVRIKLLVASWTLVRKGNSTMVTFQACVDPGGFAPAWIVNRFSTGHPYNTLAALRKMVNKK